MEGSCPDHPVAYHHDNLYSHTKHSCQNLDKFLCFCKSSSSSPFVFSEWIKNISPDVKTGDTADFGNHEGSYYDAMPSVWKKMTVIKIIEVIYVIDRFSAETPHGKFPLTKQNVLYLIRSPPPGPNTQGKNMPYGCK